MSLCVFQGTFNPIHKAHIDVALFAKKHYGFDKILFIPAHVPPHKNIDNNMAMHRFNMVKIAISNYKDFQVSDIEYKNLGCSYTYNTIMALKKQYKTGNEKINFLIGTDAFLKIESWYKSNELKKHIHFIVFPRTEKFNKLDFLPLEFKGYDFEFAPMPFTDISSTQLRERVTQGNSINNITLPQVKEYIRANKLYSAR